MFWHQRELEDFSPEEWEQLCDGCAKCCLHKLEDEDSGEVFFTRVACRLLDHSSCRCSHYQNRFTRVSGCIQVTVAMARSDAQLPSTCAYRLIAQGKALPDWHPLISGNAQGAVEAGASVAGRVIDEQYVHPDSFEEHIITWVST